MAERPSFLMSVSFWMARWVCRYRRFWPIRLLGRFSYLFYRGYENRDFDFATNGEQWVLDQLRGPDLHCVLDVGANVGDWARLAQDHFPNATIHAFEIVPENFEQLRRKCGGLPGIILNPVGLADFDGEMKIHFSRQAHFRASAYAMPDLQTEATVSARVMRGDDYLQKHGLGKVDFLKIDVEGMEGAVLRGFKESLATGRIRMIQFEYNQTNVASGFLLYNAYQLLEPLGYVIGKLYPNYVDFRAYELAHEDFCGPNFIAVRKECTDLIRVLGG